MPAAAGNTKGRSSFFEDETGSAFSKQVEEVQVLWKLGKKKEALQNLKPLLESPSEDASVLELAASIYLDQHEKQKAREMIDRLRQLKPDAAALEELEGSLLIQEGRWQEARPIYEELSGREHARSDIRRTYADILAHEREWTGAREIYAGLLRETKSPEILDETRRITEEGSPQISTRFQYFIRPQAQRDYIIQHKGSFWLYPWLRLGAGFAEEIYRLKGRDGAPAIHRFVMSHFFGGEFYLGDFLSLLAEWKSAYYDSSDFQELDFLARWNRGPFHSEIGYEWNHAARDPIEALKKHGQVNRLRANNHITFWGRLDAGDEITTEWYRVNGKTNTVNGANDLGHKFINDAYAVLTLWPKQPYLAVNYHYRIGHWDQKFEHAGEVLGFLPEEQAHQGGFYAEYRFCSFFEASAAVTRGSDAKRHVDYLFWNFEGRFWLREDMKAILGYEYDLGDSGTAGRGDTQILSTSLNYYF